MSELPTAMTAEYAAAVLQWYSENGVDEALSDAPVDRLAPKPVAAQKSEPATQYQSALPPEKVKAQAAPVALAANSELKAEALALASAAQNLEGLKAAIAGFEGLSLKKTAMNLVFADGNPDAAIMVIGDAPEAEDDRSGLPFCGEMGQLTDKMFGAIGRVRAGNEAGNSIYLTNLLNWRPPGNRSPLPIEIELSLPFLLRHIELKRPKIIYLMGGVVSKALLETNEAIGKLRGKTHTLKIGEVEFPVIASYHPNFLLKSPLKKRDAWEDLQMLAAHPSLTA